MNELVLQEQNIKNQIFTIGDMQVMIDRNLRSILSTTNFSKTRINPKVFTEQGIYMLETIQQDKNSLKNQK